MAKVIYADWDDRLGTAVRQFMEPAGIECAVVTRGAQVLDTLRESNAAVIISEVMLPDVCGFEICRRVRADVSLFSTPVMLVSSMAADEEIRHGLAQGADDFLSKPFLFPQLLARVQALIANAPEARQSDPLTQLNNHRWLKYMVQHRISNRRGFALVCFEVTSLAEFSQRAGESARGKVLRHVARILEACGRRLKDKHFSLAHMGAGHFMCLVHPEVAEAFSKAAYQVWMDHLPELYDSLGITQKVAENLAVAQKTGTIPPVNPLLYFMIRSEDRGRTGQECFEILAQVREMALFQGCGVFIDRRGR